VIIVKLGPRRVTLRKGRPFPVPLDILGRFPAGAEQ